jgi:hypothetical protein
MRHQVRDNSKNMACSKPHSVLALASGALLLGAGAIMGPLPALAGDNNAENSAGEGNFDHSGIYSILASHGDFGGPSADASTGDRRYYYLQGRGWVPFNVRPDRPVRGN